MAAGAAERNASYRFGRELSALESELATHAPVELIDEFVAEMRTRLDRLLETGVQSVTGPRDVHGWPRWSFNNKASFDAAIESLNEAIGAARALAIDPTIDDFEAALTAIRGTIREPAPVEVPRQYRSELARLRGETIEAPASAVIA